MAGPTNYLQRDATTGRLRELLGAQASAGAADAGRLVALDANGFLDPSLFPAGFGETFAAVEADEALVAGDLVYLFDDAGTPKCAKASAAVAGNPAQGYVLDAFNATDLAVVFFSGINSQVAGLLAGQRRYLGETAGANVSAPVTGAGKLHQLVGKGVSATELLFEPDDDILLAE